MTGSDVIFITFYNWFSRQFNAIEVKQSLRKSVCQMSKSVFVVFLYPSSHHFGYLVMFISEISWILGKEYRRA